MRVLIFGSRDWNNYSEVMRTLAVLLEDLNSTEEEHKRLTIVHSGHDGAENMVTEFICKVDKLLRQNKVYVKEELYRANPTNTYNIIEKGADSAIVFTTKNDKRINYCIQMLEQFNIPTKIIQ